MTSARCVSALISLACLCAVGTASTTAAQSADAGPRLRLFFADGGLPSTDAGVVSPTVSAPPAQLVPPPVGHEPVVSAKLSRPSVTLGEITTFELTVKTRSSSDRVSLPTSIFGTLVEGSMSPFDVTERRSADPGQPMRNVPGDKPTDAYRFQIDLLALANGEHTLEAIPIQIVTADGQVGTVLSPSIRAEVKSAVGNVPNAEPKGATKPVVVMEDDYTLAWIGGTIGVLLLGGMLGALVARWWKKRPKPLPPPPPARPAWEIALEKLAALRASATHRIATGRTNELVDGVSDTIREYLGGRYGFVGLESTTDEVLRHLKTAKLGAISLDEVALLLGDCDLVKFAKAVPEAQQVSLMIDTAVRIVRATSPGTAPATPVTAPPALSGGTA